MMSSLSDEQKKMLNDVVRAVVARYRTEDPKQVFANFRFGPEAGTHDPMLKNIMDVFEEALLILIEAGADTDQYEREMGAMAMVFIAWFDAMRDPDAIPIFHTFGGQGKLQFTDSPTFDDTHDETHFRETCELSEEQNSIFRKLMGGE